MGTTKYPIMDDAFQLKMLGACQNDEQRGLLTVLELTGMHISAVCALGPENLRNQGGQKILAWRRPKTKKSLERFVPKDRVDLITQFLAMKRKSRQYYWELVRRIGKSAGYDDVSPMTYRHNQCIKAIENSDNLLAVPHMMGCTFDVVARNYSKKREYESLVIQDGKT